MKKKITLEEISRYGYHSFSRFTAKQSKNGIGFYRYVMDKVLSDSEQAEISNKFNNVRFGKVSYIFASEIRYTTLLVFDKVLDK